jgi:hypothetical protein
LFLTNDVQSYSKESQYLNCIFKDRRCYWFGSAVKLVSAQQNGSSLPIKFDKTVRSGTEFKFVIDKIQRLNESKVVIIWRKCTWCWRKEVEYTICVKGDFKIMKVDIQREIIKWWQSIFQNHLQGSRF